MVDDDPDVRTSVARGLRHSGFDVRVAATGKEALRLLSNESHDALVLDVQMPELDGVAVVTALRALGNDIPICVLSLIEPGHLTWPQLIEKLTVNPARVLGIDRGTLKRGAVADVTVIDPTLEWTIDPQQFRSKSRNSPFAGWKVRGKAHTVLVGGEVKTM